MLTPRRRLPRRAVLLACLGVAAAACGPGAADDRRRPGASASVASLPTATPQAVAPSDQQRRERGPAPPAGPAGAPTGRDAGRPAGGVRRAPSRPPKLALVWSADGGPDPLRRPIAAAVDRRGDVYVVDAGDDRIRVFDRDGRPRAPWGGEGGDAGQFRFRRRAARRRPAGACARRRSAAAWPWTSRDRVYVADFGNHRVQVFDRDGRFLAAWGREGGGAGRVPAAERRRGRRAGPRPRLRLRNRRIQQFDDDGRFLAEWGSAPGGLAVDERGRVYVGYPWLGRVQVFDGQGRFLAMLAWGGPGGGGPDASALAVDRAGRMYVAGVGAEVLQLDGEGRLVASWSADCVGEWTFGEAGGGGGGRRR